MKALDRVAKKMKDLQLSRNFQEQKDTIEHLSTKTTMQQQLKQGYLKFPVEDTNLMIFFDVLTR